jgi:hypothetical protein
MDDDGLSVLSKGEHVHLLAQSKCVMVFLVHIITVHMPALFLVVMVYLVILLYEHLVSDVIIILLVGTMDLIGKNCQILHHGMVSHQV